MGHVFPKPVLFSKCLISTEICYSCQTLGERTPGKMFLGSSERQVASRLVVTYDRS